MLSATDYEELLILARGSLDHGLLHEAPLFKNPRLTRNELRVQGETFISLQLHGKNRGCMGNTFAPKPIFETVLTNAFRAGFEDNRFRPITAAILPRLTLELYHLLPENRRSFAVTDLNSFINLIKPADSIVLTYMGLHATMLHSMQQQYETLQDLMLATREKLNVPKDVSWKNIICTLIETTKTPARSYTEIPPCPLTA